MEIVFENACLQAQKTNFTEAFRRQRVREYAFVAGSGAPQGAAVKDQTEYP